MQGEKVWETARRAQARLPRREPLLVVRDGRLDRPDGHAAADLPRRRPQVAGLLHVPAAAARQPDRPARRRSRSSSTGARRRTSSRSKWIADAAQIVLDNEQLDLLLVYLPHLDYDLQRFGPEGPEAVRAAQELDEVAGDLVDHARARGDQVVVLSEYGITPARRPGGDQPRAAPRRAAERLHAGGHGVPGPVDVARVRGRRPPDRPRLRRRSGRPPGRRARCSKRLDGVGEVLEGESLAAAGLGHERSGELVVLAERDAWFTYHYWLDNAHAPGLRPAGRDPPQAGLRPRRAVHGSGRREGCKLRAGTALARKKAGMRYVMSVVGPRRVQVRQGHARAAAAPTISTGRCSCAARGRIARDRVAATDVRDLLLELERRSRERARS